MNGKIRKIFSGALASIMLMSSIVIPAAAEENDTIQADIVYSAAESPSKTYNMNLDWHFLAPTMESGLEETRFTRALNGSVDANGKYFYETDYDELTVTGRGVKDAHGNVYEGNEWTTVSIPHQINALQGYSQNGKQQGEQGIERGIYLYRKTFTVPENAADGKVFFELEGIRQAAYLWVNGYEVGYYEAGITAMGFDITKYVNAGEDALIAIVEDGTSAGGVPEKDKIPNTDITYKNYIRETKPTEPISATEVGLFDWKTQWGKDNGQGYQWNTKDFQPVRLGLIYDAYLHIKGNTYQTLPLYNNLKTTGNYIYADNFDIKGKTATINVDAEVRNESGEDKELTLQIDVVDHNGILKGTYETNPVTVETADDAGIIYATAVNTNVYDTDESGTLIGDNVTSVDTVDVTHINASFDMEDMRFWNTDDPYLYTVYTTLKENGKAIDVQKKITGFRKINYTIDGGLEINDRYVWLTGYAQRSTNAWAVVGSGSDWLNDYDMSLVKESGANFIRWMHVAPKPSEVRSSDKYGVAVVVPAGDKESDSSGRAWSQRTEAMRDVMIYFRNNPSVIFWETGNSDLNAEHTMEMKNLYERLDPNGMRFIGSRSVKSADQLNYENNFAGTMLGNHAESAKNAMSQNGIYGPIVETEYSRDEAPRRVWDDYSPPDYDYVNKWNGKPSANMEGYDSHDETSEDFSLATVKGYSTYYNNRVGGSTGNDYYTAAAILVWADSNEHTRNSGSETGRTSGRVDSVRQKKESFYAMRAAQSGESAVDILGHWSYPEYSEDTYNYFNKELDSTGTYYKYDTTRKLKRDPFNKTVYAIGSEDVEKIELYRIDGDDETLIGECDTPENTFIYSFENVDITKGDAVKAVAYNARGKAVAEDIIERTYDAYSIRLTPVTSDDGWTADGSDVMFFDVEVVDENGNVCALNYDRINFEYEGEGVWMGGINSGMGTGCFQNNSGSEGISFYFGGHKDGITTLHQDYVYAECGTSRIFVKSSRNAGEFTLTATLCDADENETAISSTATIESKAIDVTGGLSETLSPVNTYEYAENAPEIEDAPAMQILSDEFTIDWSKAEKIKDVDTTVYYDVTVNGKALNLTPKAYGGLADCVMIPMVQLIYELQKSGIDIKCEYDTTNPDDPELTVYINGGTKKGGHTIWCHMSENQMYVDGRDLENRVLPSDFPAIKDEAFCYDALSILMYVDGLKIVQDKENQTLTMTYDLPTVTPTITPTISPDVKISVEITEGNAVISTENAPAEAKIYAAKYASDGSLVRIDVFDGAKGGNTSFVPDKVFLWTKDMSPIDMWSAESENVSEISLMSFIENEEYDVLMISKDFNDETNTGSADGTNYMISDGTYKIWSNADNKLYYGNNFNLSADVMFTAEKQTIEFTNSGKNKGPALYVSGNKLISSAGSKTQTLYSNMSLNKWYKIEYEGRMGVTGAVTNFKLYEYNENGEAVEVSSFSKLELRNFWAGNNKFPGYATVAEGICVDNEYAAQLYPDTVTITEQSRLTEMYGGDTLTFDAVASRAGVSDNITQPEFEWTINGISEGQKGYFSISDDGILTVSALADEQIITVKAVATSNGNPYAEYPVTVHSRSLTGEKFDSITVNGKNAINAGESCAYTFTAMKDNSDVTNSLTSEDVVWQVMDSTGTRVLNNSKITISNGTLTVDKSALAQNIKVRASTVSGYVYNEVDVAISSTSDEKIINENACEDKVDGVTLNQGSWDGSSYYTVDTVEDFLGAGTLGTTTTSGDVLISMDIKFTSQTGSGITTVRRDGGTGFWLVSHNGVLACQTGGSAYTDLKGADGNTYALDTDKWYHIEFMFATSAPSLNIWKYNENGTLEDKQTFTSENGMTFRSSQGFNRIKLNKNTGIDNYRVLTPRATSLAITASTDKVSAGTTMEFTPIAERDGLAMPNIAMENISWTVYDSNNEFPVENDDITVTAGKLSTDILTAPQKIYVRATSTFDKTVYGSYAMDIVKNNMFEVKNIGVAEDNENNIAKIFVEKQSDYNDNITFIIALYDENGVFVGSYAKKTNGKNLQVGENEIALDYTLPEGFDKETGSAKIFVWTTMTTEEEPDGISKDFSANYTDESITLTGVENTSANAAIAVYMADVKDSDLAGDLDNKVVYVAQAESTDFGTIYIPNLAVGKYIAAVGTVINGEYRAYRAEFIVE